jgi:hypothetical protein
MFCPTVNEFLLGALYLNPGTQPYLKLNYVGSFQEFFAPSSSTNSFERWTVDLNHMLYIYGNAKSAASSADQQAPIRAST